MTRSSNVIVNVIVIVNAIALSPAHADERTGALLLWSASPSEPFDNLSRRLARICPTQVASARDAAESSTAWRWLRGQDEAERLYLEGRRAYAFHELPEARTLFQEALARYAEVGASALSPSREARVRFALAATLVEMDAVDDALAEVKRARAVAPRYLPDQNVVSPKLAELFARVPPPPPLPLGRDVLLHGAQALEAADLLLWEPGENGRAQVTLIHVASGAERLRADGDEPRLAERIVLALGFLPAREWVASAGAELLAPFSSWGFILYGGRLAVAAPLSERVDAIASVGALGDSLNGTQLIEVLPPVPSTPYALRSTGAFVVVPASLGLRYQAVELRRIQLAFAAELVGGVVYTAFNGRAVTLEAFTVCPCKGTTADDALVSFALGGRLSAGARVVASSSLGVRLDLGLTYLALWGNETITVDFPAPSATRAVAFHLNSPTALDLSLAAEYRF